MTFCCGSNFACMNFSFFLVKSLAQIFFLGKSLEGHCMNFFVWAARCA